MAQGAALCGKFHQAVELIGRRWSGAVIQILLQGRSRYAELRATIPEISDRMLSERLRELEEEGIVRRTVIPMTPVRVEYELTDKGRALEPSLMAISVWAERWVGVRNGDAPAPAAAKSSERERRGSDAPKPADKRRATPSAPVRERRGRPPARP
jgi:DNA-binding HxlR family transcriptional regulator